MSAVSDLTLLYGRLARFLAPGAASLDGTLRRGELPIDRRDPDLVVKAGRLSGYMHRMLQANPQRGPVYEAVLREFFSRAGIVSHQLRLEAAVAALDQLGLRPRPPRRPRRRGKPCGQEAFRFWSSVLGDAIKAFSAARQDTLTEERAIPRGSE
jgi:hypothetical protein